MLLRCCCSRVSRPNRGDLGPTVLLAPLRPAAALTGPTSRWRASPTFRAPMVAMNHLYALVARLIHDRGVVRTVLLGFGDEACAQRVPGDLGCGQRRGRCGSLEHERHRVRVNRVDFTLPCRSTARNTGHLRCQRAQASRERRAPYRWSGRCRVRCS